MCNSGAVQMLGYHLGMGTTKRDMGLVGMAKIMQTVSYIRDYQRVWRDWVRPCGPYCLSCDYFVLYR